MNTTTDLPILNDSTIGNDEKLVQIDNLIQKLQEYRYEIVRESVEKDEFSPKMEEVLHKILSKMFTSYYEGKQDKFSEFLEKFM